MPAAITSINTSLIQLEDDRIAENGDLDARVGVLEGGCSQAAPWSQLYANKLYLGGIGRASWPAASSGAFGLVVYGGAITLAGSAGVTVTHNLSLSPTPTAYIIIVTCNDIAKLGTVGEIAYTKAANSVLIKNSGNPNRSADICIVDLNP